MPSIGVTIALIVGGSLILSAMVGLALQLLLPSIWNKYLSRFLTILVGIILGVYLPMVPVEPSWLYGIYVFLGGLAAWGGWEAQWAMTTHQPEPASPHH